MQIDWNETGVRITVTGRANWPRGTVEVWAKSTPDHALLYVFQGTGALHGREAAPLRPGACLWVRPGIEYRAMQDPKDPVRHHYIHFELIEPGGGVRPYSMPQPPEILEPWDTSVVEVITRRVTELLPFYDRKEMKRFPPANIAISECLLRGLLMELDSASSDTSKHEASGTRLHHNQMIMKVVAHIQERQAVNVVISELAEAAGYSAEHFSRVFRNVMGQSPEDYLIQHRIEHAKQLLRESPLTIQQIASKVGYNQSSFFSTQFSRRVGMSPRAYRQRANSPTA